MTANDADLDNLLIEMRCPTSSNRSRARSSSWMTCR